MSSIENNIIQLKRIDKLLNEKRDEYLIDMHIHTHYSADGIISVKEVINRAKYYKFDIISITDHDSIDAYKEINELDSKDFPIIIPGIEFSVSYPEYEERCHVLKYFYNMNDSRFKKNLEQNKDAYWNRIELQFERIHENPTLQYFSRKYNIEYSIEDYKLFLKNNNIKIPEYPTLMEYLFSLLIKNDVMVWDVFNKAMEDNQQDPCKKRKQKKIETLERFYKKYINENINRVGRKLKPILAPVGIDDKNFIEYKSSGSLSVHEYNQISINDVNNSGINILAHPNPNKIDCIDSLSHVLSGLELNIRSERQTNNDIMKKAKKNKLLITRGSDSHFNTEASYNALDFYKMKHNDLLKISQRLKKSLENDMLNRNESMKK